MQFIGREGRVLVGADHRQRALHVKGDEGYVRARILESNGLTAWTQPVMVGSAAR